MINVTIEKVCPRCTKVSHDSLPGNLDGDTQTALKDLNNRDEARKELEALLRSTLFAAHPDVVIAYRAPGQQDHTVVSYDRETLCFSPKNARNKGCRPVVSRLLTELLNARKKD